jgi:transmembrane sensor
MWVAGVAIASSLAFGLIWVAAPSGSRFPAPSEIANAAPTQRFATGVGERRDVTLPDGSRVTLNTASLLEVRYTSNRRDVRLLQGQALFRVAHNPDRPFVVLAGNRQITATGTAFDVRIRPSGEVQVLLVEGHVRVEPANRQGLARLIPSLAETDLDPGEQLVTKREGAPMVAPADVDRETAWNRGVIIFRDDSVGDALREVNRYSAVQLVAEDPRVAGLRISGIFPTARREDFVAALETLYPVIAERETAGTIQLRWQTGRRTPTN